MTRGTETQETPQVPQEGRDQSEQIQEQDLEAQRDQEVVAEPEAVVERERPVEESEAIEAAIVEAVEAVIEDRGPGAEDGEIVAELDETSYKVESPALEGEEGPNWTPPEWMEDGEVEVLDTPTEDRRPETEDGEIVAEMDETSFKVESQAEVVEEVLDEISYKTKPAEFTEAMDETSYKVESQAEVVEEVLDDISYKTKPAEFAEGMDETSYKSESSAPESELKEGLEAEVSDAILEGADFKFFTPQPDQILGDSSILQEDLGAKTETEVSDEILDGADFKFFTPQPEGELGESSIPQEDLGSRVEAEVEEVILEEGSFKPVPAHIEAGDIEGEDHWSEPVSEEGSAVEEPVEGNIEDVEEGQEEEGGSILIGEEGEELQEVDLTAEATKEVEEYWEPPEMYAYEDSEGNIIFVDAEGNPINSPPQYKVDPNDYSVQAWYQGGNKNEFNVKKFPGHSPDDIYAYHEPDGSITLVDGNGNMIPSPPQFKTNGNIAVKVDEGKGIYFKVIKDYNPPTDGIFAYTNPDGSIDIVDKEGNLVKSPLHFFQDGTDPRVYAKTTDGRPIEIPKYEPPTEGIFLYQAQDGSYTVVDKNGQPVKNPPHLVIEGMNKPHLQGEESQVIELEEYQPPKKDVFAYTAQDGSVYLVDKDGNQINSPPHFDVDPISGQVYTKGKEDSAIQLEVYKQPMNDMFIHLGQDGSISIVDKNGKLIESPPNITIDYDPSGQPVFHAKYAGMAVEESSTLNYYKPPSAHWEKK